MKEFRSISKTKDIKSLTSTYLNLSPTLSISLPKVKKKTYPKRKYRMKNLKGNSKVNQGKRETESLLIKKL
jgi:hypothetical protein